MAAASGGAWVARAYSVTNPPRAGIGYRHRMQTATLYPFPPRFVTAKVFSAETLTLRRR